MEEYIRPRIMDFIDGDVHVMNSVMDIPSMETVCMFNKNGFYIEASDDAISIVSGQDKSSLRIKVTNGVIATPSQLKDFVKKYKIVSDEPPKCLDVQYNEYTGFLTSLVVHKGTRPECSLHSIADLSKFSRKYARDLGADICAYMGAPDELAKIILTYMYGIPSTLSVGKILRDYLPRKDMCVICQLGK